MLHVRYKNRSINTDYINRKHTGTIVSNFHMYDSYKIIQSTNHNIVNNNDQIDRLDSLKTIEFRNLKTKIERIHSFQLALTLTLRILASNNYEYQQRRFRNMFITDPLAVKLNYNYRLSFLWSFTLPSYLFTEYDEEIKETVEVSDISWCPTHGDILAVAYAYRRIYKNPLNLNATSTAAENGFVCVWNIKNPINPERHYKFPTSVCTCVEFSPFTAKLIAIGLGDGSVYVYDISKIDYPEVGISQRKISSCYEPIVALKWLAIDEYRRSFSYLESLLALCRNGSVTHFTIIRNSYLFGRNQNKFTRADGKLEGLTVERNAEHQISCRQVQSLAMCIDILQESLYYVTTDEGTIYKCSINRPQQYLQILQLHEAGINYIEFSPWSPKLYLTCGNDWYIRLWFLGILKPIVTLRYGISPILKACWSRTHSCLIVSLTQTTIDIWDLKRSILKPVSTTHVRANTQYTTFSLSICGGSINVGNNCGEADMLAFNDMPFPAHFQYENLRKTLLDIISYDTELVKTVRNMGYFGN